MPKKNFNIVIVGTGGQGQITLLHILTKAAQLENLDVKTSELHGLSQKGGSVEAHIRFGKKILSPLVEEGRADLVISLETQEAVKACYYASREAKTRFLVNDLAIVIPGQKILVNEAIAKILKKFSAEAVFVPATAVCQKEFNAPVAAGVYLVSLAAFSGLLPLKPASVKKAIKETIKPKYANLNLKIFELARQKAGDAASSVRTAHKL